MANPTPSPESGPPAPKPPVRSSTRAAPAGSGADRRKYFRLRELIDEMLASVRVATNQELMSAEERADAERQLTAIMARVRREALDPSERAAAPAGDRAD